MMVQEVAGMTDQTTPSRRYWLGGKRAAEQDRFFRDALDPLGWEVGDDEQWDAGWYTGMPDPAQFKKVSPERKLNHYPGNNALTVKSRLHDTLVAVKDRVAQSFGTAATSRLAFFPRVYSMPEDYHDLQQTALAHPEKRWILKPKNASKGKGIRVLRDVADTPLETNWMVQEYLANPHTIRGHKYVLRLYVLVASIQPLRLYLYHQGFAKLASEPYDPNDMDNPFSQLTNPDINALNTSAEIPVEFIDLQRYRQWLREQGHDDECLFAQIHDLVTLTVIGATDAIRRRTAQVGADPQGCYELLGLDCMVDDALKPWILECNLSPSLGICAEPENGGLVEAAVKGGLVKDMVSLVGIDNPAVAARSAEVARRGVAAELARDAQDEEARAGGFLRLFPNAEPERYLPFFTLPSLADMHLADGLAGQPLPRPVLTAWQVSEVLDEDQLALYATHTGRYYRLNDSAALIWLLATEGFDPDAIVDQLSRAGEASGADAEPRPDRQELLRHVWDCLSEWCREGLLRQRGAQDDGALAPVEAASDASVAPSCQPMRLACGGRQWILHTDSAPALSRLSALLYTQLTPLQEGDDTARSPRLEVLRDAPGYALASEGRVLASRLTLAELGPQVLAYLARQAPSSEQLVIDAGLLTSPQGDAVICLFPDTGDAHAMLRQFARTFRVTRGLRLDALTLSHGEPLGLPIALDDRNGCLDDSEPEDSLPDSVQVRGVILMRHHPEALNGADGEPMAPDANDSELSTLDALGALLPSSFTVGGKPLSGATVTALSEWLSRCERLTLPVASDSQADRRTAETQGEPADVSLSESLERRVSELLGQRTASARGKTEQEELPG
ncbi:amylase [Billgrantia montanilacus]|uniref:Amylase n=2 Tax=Billgrantia montanilacus TaxID=2282305 RepID=A0A368U3F9_9GAMM|nr:amylase [Halomonas montanilacus]